MPVICSDKTGRFKIRPFFYKNELDKAAEELVVDFIIKHHGSFFLPIDTEDLLKLIEQHTQDLDVYADLSGYGGKVEGLTKFISGQLPLVQISEDLSVNPAKENRYRTTLAHEFGHVYLHDFLFQEGLYLSGTNQTNQIVCRDVTITHSTQSDWLEWQAYYFGSALLMPKSILIDCVVQWLTEFKTQGHTDEESIPVLLVSKVAQAFQVSRDAARVRLSQVEILT